MNAADGAMLNVSDAARVLGVNKSTVSRNLDKFVASGLVKTQERDGKKFFNVDEYRRAFDNVSNPAKARMGGAAIEMGFVAGEGGPRPFATSPASKMAPLATASAATKAMEAQLMKIKLDRELGLIVDRAAVTQTLQTAARALRDELLGLPARVKGELASITDPAEIHRVLDKAVKESLTRFAASLEDLAANAVRDPEPETASAPQAQESMA